MLVFQFARHSINCSEQGQEINNLQFFLGGPGKSKQFIAIPNFMIWKSSPEGKLIQAALNFEVCSILASVALLLLFVLS
jgi:hypothetical protein